MASTKVDPYKVLSDNYAKRTAAIEAQTKNAEAERQQREQAAQKTLENSNRGVYTTYKQAINPYGSFASQNNFSSGVSDYYKNASYGTMLQGIGTNQYNYNDAINNSNSLWQNYLAEKAGNEADALEGYNSAVLAQQKYDKEQADAEAERQEAIRQYNLNLKLQQEQLARQKAADAEEKRRYDQEWAYQLKQDALAKAAASSGSSGGSSGGSSRSTSSSDSNEKPDDYNTVVSAGVQTINGTKYYVKKNKYGDILSKEKYTEPKKTYTSRYASGTKKQTYGAGLGITSTYTGSYKKR